MLSVPRIRRDRKANDGTKQQNYSVWNNFSHPANDRIVCSLQYNQQFILLPSEVILVHIYD